MFTVNRSELVLVDLQYCHGNDDNIYVKELAFMGGSSVAANYFLFKPPFDIRELTRAGRKKNAYCKKFINDLDWADGDISYCNVGDIISPLNNYKYIFVVGKAKKDFLKKYVTTTIINLENKTSFKNLTNYFTSCPIHHDMRFTCALNNLYKIFVFIEKNVFQLEDIVLDEINF